MNDPFLSIVIPAYNEQDRIEQSIEEIATFLSRQSFKTEVIIADDGSEDRMVEVARPHIERYAWLSLLSLPHRGKGHAVKQGMLAASGRYLFACDADLSMPIEGVLDFLPPRIGSYDIAIGSREVKGSRRIAEPQHRHVMGRAFNKLVQSLVLRGFSDTQAGFKCFKREAAHQIFPFQTLDGWAFDVEILHIAQQWGLDIREIPIEWHYRSKSQVRPVVDTLSMLREVITIKRNSLAGMYERQEGVEVAIINSR